MIEGVLLSLDGSTATAFLLGVLSLRWWFLGPASLVCLAMGGEFAWGAPLLGLGLSLMDQVSRVDRVPWLKERLGAGRVLIFFLFSFLGLLLFWRQGGMAPWAMILLPWCWYLPIDSWMTRNPGGGAMWLPLVVASSVLVLLQEEGMPVAFLEASLGAFFLLVGWYRKIPVGLKLLALALGACFWMSLAFHRLDLFVVMLGMALLQALESRSWGKGECPQVPWVLYVAVAWSGLLLFGASPLAMGWLPMGLLLVATQLLSQEINRLCLAPAKCRERVFWAMASRMPMIFGLLWVSDGVHPIHLVWLMFFCLGAESIRLTRLQPMKESVIGDSPCRLGWEKGLE